MSVLTRIQYSIKEILSLPSQSYFKFAVVPIKLTVNRVLFETEGSSLGIKKLSNAHPKEDKKKHPASLSFFLFASCALKIEFNPRLEDDEFVESDAV